MQPALNFGVPEVLEIQLSLKYPIALQMTFKLTSSA